MKFQIIDTETKYHVSVLDDNGNTLVPYCSYEYPNFFTHQNDLYVALGPYFGLSHDWEVYKLIKVA